MRSISFCRARLASHNLRRQYHYMNDTSGVGVLDKAVSVLAATESGPATLAQLVDATGLARPTPHPIAGAPVPIGAALPMTAGSAAQVLLAWEEGERMHRGLRGAKFTATTLAGVRRRGWAASAAEREAGVASVSAPVRGGGGAGGPAGSGRVLAAV